MERLFADEASTLAKATTATGYVGYPVPQRDRGALIFRYRNLHSATTATRPVVFEQRSRRHGAPEAQFKTLKYRPAFPDRFGSIQDARAHCHFFFPWYNAEHHHVGLGLLTPADMHHGLAEQRVAARATVLATAYAAHPERFPRGLPQPPARPMEVWINPPKPRATEQSSHTPSNEPVVAYHAESMILDPERACD